MAGHAGGGRRGYGGAVGWRRIATLVVRVCIARGSHWSWIPLTGGSRESKREKKDEVGTPLRMVGFERGHWYNIRSTSRWRMAAYRDEA